MYQTSQVAAGKLEDGKLDVSITVMLDLLIVHSNPSLQDRFLVKQKLHPTRILFSCKNLSQLSIFTYPLRFIHFITYNSL